VKSGQTSRFDCECCNVEFELTLEPKVKPDSRDSRESPDQEVLHCPFCGEMLAHNEEDEDDE
jgi:hypothetical protein